MPRAIYYPIPSLHIRSTWTRSRLTGEVPRFPHSNSANIVEAILAIISARLVSVRTYSPRTERDFNTRSKNKYIGCAARSCR